MALVVAASVQAAITTTGNIDPADPTSWTSSTNSYIGKNADGTLTVNGGSDVESRNTIIGGYLSGDSGVTGTVTLDGTGSTWTNSYLMVGNYGTGMLNITSGGLVTSNSGASVGANSTGGGTVTVDGAGSQWITDTEGWHWLYVGDYGDGTLTVSNGGVVSSATSVIGNYTGSGAVTVTGNGSQWTNSAELVVGFEGTGTLTIADGGLVTNTDGTIGYDSGASGTVTVNNGTWANSGYLYVGDDGTGTLTIQNGGTVSALTSYVGSSSGSTGTATVTGAGSSWTHSGYLAVGELGNGTLTIAEGGTVTNDMWGRIGYGSSATGTVTVTDAGSTWTNNDYLEVGTQGNGTLNIQSGGVVSNTNGFIGHSSDSSGTVTVTDSDSQWTNSGYLAVGFYGTGTLNIENGGGVSSTYGHVGDESGSTGMATVTGNGSTWANANDLIVGESGTGTLNIENGGAVSNVTAYIGYSENTTGTATVTGTGSTWTSSDYLTVGDNGNGTLTISDGGAVSNTQGYVGYGDDAVGNVAVNNGTWTNNSYLYVGHGGSGTLAIDNGGSVSNTSGHIGYESGSTGTVTVNNGTWTNTGALSVGRDGTGTLTIRSGGTVSNTFGYIGNRTGSTGTATVTGNGSSWTNVNSLYVGNSGDGTLRIENGGAVSNTLGYVGGVTGSTGTAAATVTGNGSTWTNSGYLYVGRDGGASLTIADGGAVSSMAGSIATEVGTTGTVTVTGTNSTWTNSDLLFVGCGITDSQLVTRGAGTLNISDGGEVIAPYAVIGSTSTLSGDGTLTLDNGSGTLTNHGTIAPGNSIGTLTVDGDVVFEDGSILEAEIDNAGNCDKLDVTGDVTINNGATLAVNSNGETIEDGQQYTLVEADGTVTGEFTTLDTALVAWDTSVEGSLEYDGSTVVLTSSVLGFDDPTLLYTENQQACGRAIEQISDGGGDLGSIPDALQHLADDSDVRNAYDQLSGQTRPSIASIARTGVSGFAGAVSGRLQNARTANLGTGGAMLAMADSTTAAFGPQNNAVVSDVAALGNAGPYDTDSRYGAWTKGFGVIGDRDSEDGVNGYDYEIGGVAAGLDYRFTENTMAGVTLGYSDTDIEYRNSPDNSRIDSLYAGLYGSYMDTDGYIDGVFAYADLDSKTDRYVGFVGEKNGKEFDGYEVSTYIEAGRNYYYKDILVQPLCGFELGYQRQDSYTEEGGESALHYGKQTFESYQSSLGAKISKYLYKEGEQSLWAQLRAKWMHQFGDAAADVTASFASAPGYRFPIKDAELNRDSAVLGTGLTYKASRNTVLFADYDATLNGDTVAHVFSAGLRYMW